MLRDTHKRIAEKIAYDLDFSTENAHIFVVGTLGPDTHGDFPHKTGKNSKILQKIDAARQLFFLNDEYAYGELGNALHYLQDKWVDDVKIADDIELSTDDTTFKDTIRHAQITENLKRDYLSIADILARIKDNGIDAWFNHQWGIWHIDYASCVYVFADIVEMMLPTLQPDSTITSNSTKLSNYVLSDSFKRATKQGLHASIITNFLEPKIEGYAAAMFTLAVINPPTGQGDLEIHLQIAHRLSREIAVYTLANHELFKYQDSWTHKTNERHLKLGLLKPQYLALIQQPISEVHRERLRRFSDENRIFLDAWPSIQKAMPTIKRTETWKTILAGLIEILETTGE